LFHLHQYLPEISKIAAEKLKFNPEGNKVQFLYFPIAEHQSGKLYIKLSEDEIVYQQTSDNVIKEPNVIFDAQKSNN